VYGVEKVNSINCIVVVRVETSKALEIANAAPVGILVVPKVPE